MGALLFDLDGTLLDTDALHHGAFADILAERARTLSVEDYRTHIMGHPNQAILERFFPDEAPGHAAIMARKDAMVMDRMGGALAPTPGIHALLDRAAAWGWGVAVVTNAPRAVAVRMLAATGLAPRLPTLVIGDECAAPKPDPAPYRTAMALLGAAPRDSVAFEDSLSGLAAAVASGAYTIGMTGALDAARLRGAGAHATVADFTDAGLLAHLQTMKDRRP